MKAKKKNTKLNVLDKKVSVDPPKGYHWMEEQGRYYLMEGEYGSHPGSIKTAVFKTATHAKKGNKK